MDTVEALRTSHLLLAIGQTGNGDTVTFDELLDRFRERAFGALLLAVLLPTFLPVPIGIGAITGPAIALVGVQMLLTFSHPWLPKWLARRGMQRRTVQRFGQRFRPWLARLERFCRPRHTVLIDSRAGRMFTGLQLVLLGALLSLPIPLTNYPIGIILLLYCIALIERDGRLLAVAWIFGIGTVVASALLSSEVVELLGRVFG